MSTFKMMIVSSFLFAGCGLTDPKFENYESTSSSSGPSDSSTDCGAEALALFESDIQPGIDGTCGTSSCHGSGGGGSGKILLSIGSTDANRTTVYAYTGLDRNKLTDYISSSSHQGGNQGTVLPVSAMTPWLDKEDECQAQNLRGQGRPGNH